MKNIDSTHVNRTMEWVNENRNIREVRMMEKQKRRKHIAWTVSATATGAVASLGCMAWFNVSIVARVATVVSLTAFAVLAIGKED